MARLPPQPHCGAHTARQGAAGAGFNANVHGARGLLAITVFCFHVASSGLPSFQWLGGARTPVAPLLCLQYGVEIFFCISGTIVTGALRRAGSPGRFLWERAVRILPVLWATLAVIVPLGFVTHQPGFAHSSARNFIGILLSNMLALPGILPIPLLHMGAWSLSYEMGFYAIAIIFWMAAPRGQIPRLCAMLLAICLVAWQPRAIFFAVGLLVARSDFSSHPVLGRAMRWPSVWLIVFATLWRVATQAGADGGAGSLMAWVLDGRIGAAALAVSAAVLAWAGITAGHGMVCHVLRTRPAQWIGTASYSFYLWHLIVLAIIKRFMATSGMTNHLGPFSQVVLFGVGLPASLLLAQASVVIIERRFVGWLKTREYPVGIFGGGAAIEPTSAITIENAVSLAA